MANKSGTPSRDYPIVPVGHQALWPVILRWMLGSLLVWAAVSKLANPTAFLGSLYAYDMRLPQDFLKLVAIVLPWVELICGILLITETWVESALILLGVLMCVFVCATGVAWMRGLEISCGCFDLKIFGLDSAYPKLVKLIESPGFAFIRNLVLTVAIATLLKYFFKTKKF